MDTIVANIGYNSKGCSAISPTADFRKPHYLIKESKHALKVGTRQFDFSSPTQMRSNRYSNSFTVRSGYRKHSRNYKTLGSGRNLGRMEGRQAQEDKSRGWT